ncbi:mechanosensitive ion channel family protein [Algoriphagus hitonicola]|uniref:Mechanosensitive ion channel n=1 Tax=Algoriphagus hitonicola TaxID=435880 RepID=A0A1I2QQJ1_9BACT|nr:mechanosensitive ion channel family protein [Algoriphagus hitonicola]SFG30865.1 Mechanosensitive ion channel [Algoriphagus hitonicola]
MEFFTTMNFDWPRIQELLKITGIALLILLAFFFIANYLQKFLKSRLVKRMDDPLLANFLSVIFRLIILLIGFMIVFRVVGLTGVVSGLLAGAGITAFVIGFALKDIGENFLAGILLAFKRPFRIGDIVDINGINGKVIMLNLRDTQIKTPDGKDVFIPNASIIKNPLTNFTIDGFLRYDFTIGLDYGSDYRQAMRLILEEINDVEGVLKEIKKASTWVENLGESTLNLQVAFWVDTFDPRIPDAAVKSEVIIRILERLAKEGFNLPSKIVELKNYRDEPFRRE